MGLRREDALGMRMRTAMTARRVMRIARRKEVKMLARKGKENKTSAI
jgi:hypothetical protein